MPLARGSGRGGGLEIERHTATVAGIMSESEFAALELTDNTRKVCRTRRTATQDGNAHEVLGG